jgi:hypothetical protein
MRFPNQKGSADRLSINTINKRNITISIVANKSNVTGINLNTSSKYLNSTITTVANNGIGINLNTNSKDLNRNLTTTSKVLSLSGRKNHQFITGYTELRKPLLPISIEQGIVAITGNYVGIRDPIIGGLQTPGTFYREVKYAGTAGAAHKYTGWTWQDMSTMPPSQTTTWDGSWSVDIKDGALLTTGNAYRDRTPSKPLGDANEVFLNAANGINPDGRYYMTGGGYIQLYINIYNIGNPILQTATKRIWGPPNGANMNNISNRPPDPIPYEDSMFQIGSPNLSVDKMWGSQLYGQLSLELLQPETPADIANNWETRTRGTLTNINSLTARSEDYRTQFRGEDRGTQGANISAFQLSVEFKGRSNKPLVIYAKIRELDVATNTTTEYTKTYNAVTNSLGNVTNIDRFAVTEINKDIVYTLLDVYAIQ